jgi:hypothetical protein
MSSFENVLTAIGKIAAWVVFICAALLFLIHATRKRFASAVVSGVGVVLA